MHSVILQEVCHNQSHYIGLETDVVYPNGISCTLPEEIQQQLVNTIAGLENAKMIHPGKKCSSHINLSVHSHIYMHKQSSLRMLIHLKH